MTDNSSRAKSSHPVIGPAMPPGFGDSDDSDSEQEIGPALPPDFGPNSSKSDSGIGPALPPRLSSQQGRSMKDAAWIGPALPPRFGPESDKSDSSTSPIGPALPPEFESPNSDPIDCKRSSIGPALPPGFGSGSSVSDARSSAIGPALPPEMCDSKRVGPVGPALPPDLDSSSDDDCDIGPRPTEMSLPGQIAAHEFERNVLRMQAKLRSKEDTKKSQREEWMTELPSVGLSSQLGLSARQFRTTQKEEITDADRESWTRVGDGPATSSSKSKKRPAPQYTQDELDNDRKTAKMVRNFNDNKRAESLMDIMQKMKKAEEKDQPATSEKPERVPFDRERDLCTKKFDDAQRKTILKKAAKLDSRFSHGGKQYL